MSYSARGTGSSLSVPSSSAYVVSSKLFTNKFGKNGGMSIHWIIAIRFSFSDVRIVLYHSLTYVNQLETKIRQTAVKSFAYF